jgi:anti-sigma regulatory factor (Ser/Thr protein kinase)
MTAAEAVLELAPDPTSPRRARAFIAMTLHEWGCDRVEGVAALLVSEVVTNAVQHGQSNAVLSARYEAGRLEVRVQDKSDSLPILGRVEPEGATGRGLILVNALSDRWGVEPLASGGKSVYFAVNC